MTNKSLKCTFAVCRFDQDEIDIEFLNTGNNHSIAETQQFTPEGAYTTFRTYNRFQILNLQKHYDRLVETAALTGKTVNLNRVLLSKALVQLIHESAEGELRIRITVDLTDPRYDVYIAIEPLHVPPAEAYQKGVEVETAQLRRSNPKAKINSFLFQADQVRAAKSRNLEEILMVNEKDEILEGLSSNFYAISGDMIFTAEEGVLSGTTRDYVLSLIAQVGLKVTLRPIHVLDVRSVDEAFITSTSRSILPVRRIDTMFLPQPIPGPVTKKLMQAFDAGLNEELEDLRAA